MPSYNPADYYNNGSYSQVPTQPGLYNPYYTQPAPWGNAGTNAPGTYPQYTNPGNRTIGGQYGRPGYTPWGQAAPFNGNMNGQPFSGPGLMGSNSNWSNPGGAGFNRGEWGGMLGTGLGAGLAGSGLLGGIGMGGLASAYGAGALGTMGAAGGGALSGMGLGAAGLGGISSFAGPIGLIGMLAYMGSKGMLSGKGHKRSSPEFYAPSYQGQAFTPAEGFPEYYMPSQETYNQTQQDLYGQQNTSLNTAMTGGSYDYNYGGSAPSLNMASGLQFQGSSPTWQGNFPSGSNVPNAVGSYSQQPQTYSAPGVSSSYLYGYQPPAQSYSQQSTPQTSVPTAATTGGQSAYDYGAWNPNYVGQTPYGYDTATGKGKSSGLTDTFKSSSVQPMTSSQYLGKQPYQSWGMY